MCDCHENKMAAAMVQMSYLYRGVLAVRTRAIRPLIPGIVPLQFRTFTMKKNSELEDNPFYRKYAGQIEQLRRYDHRFDGTIIPVISV